MSSFLEPWLCAERLHGDGAELCSLINYALAANEIESTELPLQLQVSHAKQSPLCTGARMCVGACGSRSPFPGAAAGSGSWWDVVNQATRFASHRLCGTGRATVTCQNTCKISSFQMQSIKSVKLRTWPVDSSPTGQLFPPF